MPKTYTYCTPSVEDYHNVTIINIEPDTPIEDYIKAMQLADIEAKKQLNEYMLLSWYDKDRDFESPQHSSECHLDSAVPGYIDYALYHGANLKVIFEKGRFVFFYRGF